MSRLNVETAENGFIVVENNSTHSNGKQWAFESAESLAKFIAQWGRENTKVVPVAPVAPTAPRQLS